MIEYGLAFLGWEVSLKYEVFKRDCRRESLRFSVALQKKLDVTHAMNATLLSFFPEAIQQVKQKLKPFISNLNSLKFHTTQIFYSVLLTID